MLLARAHAVWLILTAATALRVWLALDDHGIYWPDEIYQSLEQAHRLAFDTGFVPWEFRDGARSWLLPGAMAGLWRLAAALGVESSLTLVGLARLCMTLASGASIWLTARLAERLAGARAGWVAALVLSIFPLSVVLGYRALSETASAPLVALSALCVLQRSRSGAALAGAAIALACLLRYQNGLFVPTFALWVWSMQRGRGVLAFLTAGAACGLAGGLLDWVTWGAPFHSLITYVRFNLVESGASTFGVAPFWFYARATWDSTGPPLLVFASLAAVGAARAPGLGLGAFVYVLAHSLVPHKELRFLLPALPALAALTGIGAERVYAAGPRRVAWWGALGAATAGAAFSLTRLTHARLGQHLGTARAEQPIWHSDEDVNLLLAAAGREPELCGLGVLGMRDTLTGGYTYFHRAAPLLYANRACGAEAALNYLLVPAALASELLPPGYALSQQRGALGLYRRSGACAALPRALHPSGAPLLEEADDLGLSRRPAEQAPDGSLRIHPKLHAGAFREGWAPGETIDCEPARWAVGRHSVVQFRATATGLAYALHAELGLVPALAKQRLKLSLNGRPLFEGEVPARPQLLDADVPPEALELGDNRLVFDFAETWHPGGDDERELSALLHSLELVPLAQDFDIDVGDRGGDAHLGRGFGSSELDGDVRFAWSDGPSSVVEGSILDPSAAHLLEVTARAMAGTSGRARVVVGDRPLGTLQVGPMWSTQKLFIARGTLRRGLNRLRFEYEDTVTPASRDAASSDERQLSIGFDRIRIEALPPATVLDLGTPGARAALLDGWSGDEVEAERTVIWSVGDRSLLRTSLLGARLLRVEARAYLPAAPVHVDVAIGGEHVGAFDATERWDRHELVVPEQLATDLSSLIELRVDHTASPARHEPGSNDRRELALRVDRVEIVR
jgi:GPI mannosyltransferase 3